MRGDEAAKQWGGLGWLVACQANSKTDGIEFEGLSADYWPHPTAAEAVGCYHGLSPLSSSIFAGSLFGRMKVGPDLSGNRGVKFFRAPRQERST